MKFCFIGTLALALLAMPSFAAPVDHRAEVSSFAVAGPAPAMSGAILASSVRTGVLGAANQEANIPDQRGASTAAAPLLDVEFNGSMPSPNLPDSYADGDFDLRSASNSPYLRTPTSSSNWRHRCRVFPATVSSMDTSQRSERTALS